MAVIATVSKFGMEFTNAYHKIENLTYRSFDESRTIYGQAIMDENGEPAMTEDTIEWTKKTTASFEVAVYASQTTREDHAEAIYRTFHNFEVSLEANAEDLLAQAYAELKGKEGYEDAVDA